MGALVEIFCFVAEAVYAVFEKRQAKPGCLTLVLVLAVSVLLCAGIVWAALAIAARMA